MERASRNANQSTLSAYDAGIAEYVAGTPTSVSPELAAWIDKTLRMIASGSTILEIGSGTGRDAAYIEERGFNVIRSDASRGFVDYLRQQGRNAVLLDVTTDELSGPHPMIFADAVLLHLPRPVAIDVLCRLRRALAPGGVLACTLKQGNGEEWSSEKLGAPRFFCYWQPGDLRAALEQAGFSAIEIDVTQAGTQGWLMVAAIA